MKPTRDQRRRETLAQGLDRIAAPKPSRQSQELRAINRRIEQRKRAQRRKHP